MNSVSRWHSSRQQLSYQFGNYIARNVMGKKSCYSNQDLDRVTDTEVLQRTGAQTICIILSNRQLRWTGHVQRMQDTRLPKLVYYGELASGSRKFGRPHPRYKERTKRILTQRDINPDSWSAWLLIEACGGRNWRHLAMRTKND